MDLTAAPISDAVREFLGDNINSVEQLEILLLLRDSQDKSWTAAEISRLLFTSEISVGGRLRDLANKGLVEIRGEGLGTQFQYRFKDGLTDLTIWSLEHAYRRRKDAVIAIIFSPR
jgi:DNA-binding transcriptional ArsR family regulator